jgi:molybdenum cofactor biosynthesis protein B
MITADGHQVVSREIVTDDREVITERLRQLAEDPGVDVVITTGGTGVTGRDVTPEAFKQVMDKEVEGFGELFRWLSFEKVGTSTMQSRAIGGVVGDTYIFALPGSPSACKDGWMGILRFQLDSRHRPCNLVELMPRLMEHLKV